MEKAQWGELFGIFFCSTDGILLFARLCLFFGIFWGHVTSTELIRLISNLASSRIARPRDGWFFTGDLHGDVETRWHHQNRTGWRPVATHLALPWWGDDTLWGARAKLREGTPTGMSGWVGKRPKELNYPGRMVSGHQSRWFVMGSKVRLRESISPPSVPFFRIRWAAGAASPLAAARKDIPRSRHQYWT